MTPIQERQAPTLSSRSGIVYELTWFEAIRMVRHPLTWVGTLASFYSVYELFWGRGPVLERDSILLAGAMLPVAATTLLVSFYSVLRQRATPELLSTQPADRNMRLVGVQLGTFGPGLVGLAVMTIGTVYLLSGDPIGRLLWLELLSGIIMIPAAGVVGTALARWLPHPIVAPVALVGLGVVQFWASPGFEVFDRFPWSDYVNADIEWLAPWMVIDGFAPLDVIGDRPAFLHLLFLIVFGLVVAYLTRERIQARFVSRVAVAAGFVVVLGTVSVGIADDEADVFEWPAATEAQVCRVDDGVEYCAFRFYEGWIPRWQATVAAVDELAPVDLDRVVQRPHNIGWDDDSGLGDRTGLALTTLEWDRPGATPEQQFSLALMAAQTSVGLPGVAQLRPFTEAEIDEILEQNPDASQGLREALVEEERERSCSAVGQARTVAAVWIAGSATPDGARVVDWLIERRPEFDRFSLAFIDPSHRLGVIVGRPDAELARRLLTLPEEEVHTTFTENWDGLVDPQTTSAVLASWFGQPEPDEVELDFETQTCS